VFDANRSIGARPGRRIALRIETDRDFNYVAGAFYQHDITKFCALRSSVFMIVRRARAGRLAARGYNNNPQVLCNQQTEESKALYGETNYKFTDATTLTVGARITEDSKDWIGRQQYSCSNWHRPRAPSFRRSRISNWAADECGELHCLPVRVVTIAVLDATDLRRRSRINSTAICSAT